MVIDDASFGDELVRNEKEYKEYTRSLAKKHKTHLSVPVLPHVRWMRDNDLWHTFEKEVVESGKALTPAEQNLTIHKLGWQRFNALPAKEQEVVRLECKKELDGWRENVYSSSSRTHHQFNGMSASAAQEQAGQARQEGAEQQEEEAEEGDNQEVPADQWMDFSHAEMF